MDTLKAQLLKIQQQLTGLSVSQKMLTASLVAIMVMTILWWARYAGTAEMGPVLDQAFSPTDVGRIQSVLATGGIKSTLLNDRVLVPSDRKLEAVALLAYSEALPSNITSAWDEIAKQMSPWDPASKTDSLQNRAKERVLSAMIAAHFPGVATANVVINPISQRLVGGSREPTATVLINTKSGAEANAKKLANSTASAVASAVSGLTPGHVTVIINGMKQKVIDQDSSIAGASDLFDQTAMQESHYAGRLAELYPGAIASVKVSMDNTTTRENTTTYDPDKIISKLVREDTEKQETPQPGTPALEPGAASNTGLNISAAPVVTAGASATVDKSKIENQVFANGTISQTEKPAGATTILSAALRIPRSYFVRMIKGMNPSETKEPDNNAVLQVLKNDLPNIKTNVQMSLGLKTPDNISVDMYYDEGTVVLGDNIAAAQSGSGVGAIMTSHVREIAVGALALVSLFMVSTIVKKGTPPPTIIPEPGPRETPRLASGETIAGIVGDSNPTMDAMEVDEDAIKAQQMVEQVSTMVKENPDAAANLVKRWLNRS